MGWIWGSNNSGNDGSTRKIVRSQCATEEVEPGKFVRKCEKVEELFQNCVGKPAELVESNREYTEEDVTAEVLKGGPAMFDSSNHGMLDNFPGLRNDLEVIERNLAGGLGRFLEAAEEMSNSFFNSIAKSPGIFDAPSTRQGIPIDEFHRQGAHPKPKEEEEEFAGKAQDV